MNATCIAELGEIDMATLGDRIADDALKVWSEVLPTIPGDVPLPFHAGAVSTIEPLMGVMLLEMLVHGDDLARATGRTYEIDEDDAWLCLQSTCSLFSAFRRLDVAGANDVIALVDERDQTQGRAAVAGDHTVEPRLSACLSSNMSNLERSTSRLNPRDTSLWTSKRHGK